MASEQVVPYGTRSVVEVLYIGFGAFLPGVPARDLSAAEWAALDEETRELALALDLYQEVRDEGSGVRGQEEAEVAEAEGVTDGREDAAVVDDDPPGAADGGESHRAVRRYRRGQAQG